MDSSSESHASFDLDGTTLFIHVAGEGDQEGAPNADHVARDPDGRAVELQAES